MIPFLLIAAAVVFGFAVQRSGLCVVSGLTDLIDRGSANSFTCFFTISFWAALCGWGLWSWLPGAQPDLAYRVTLAALAGGLVFGIGAAINGGCFFGTITRLGAGDLSFLATFAGLASGAGLQRPLSWLIDLPQPDGPSLVARSPFLALGLLAVLFCLYKVVARFEATDISGRPAEAAAPIVGGSGSFLYAMHGAWVYPLAVGPLASSSGIAVLSSATLCGACLAAVRDGSFAVRFSWPALPRRLIGGAAMGFGSVLIPGGNGALILQGLPSLSPHAPAAYASLVLGAGLTLLLSPRLRRSTALGGRA